MNKREFLKSLLVAAVAPAVLLPRAADHYQWRKTTSGVWVINPAWRTAEYGLLWCNHAKDLPDGHRVEAVRLYRRDRDPGEDKIICTNEGMPLRYREERGRMIAIEPFVQL